jgi:DNA helicase II / ATP-dependent DNA helicase PcrA
MPISATSDASSVGPLLAGLNPTQREAAEAVTGPVRILAGAGSGKTRTITHRIAHQIAAGVAEPSQVLAVTFTDRAASELRDRLAGLGLAAPVRAATFHSAAWAQLRFFWPRVLEGPLPAVLPSKVRALIPLSRRLGMPAKDLAAEIEWAKARCIAPEDYADAAGARDLPAAPQRLAAAYADYERRKAEDGLIDYEDMLLRTATLIAEHPEVAAQVRERYRFFTVDEFQDVNPAQWRLLRAWLGDSDEVCVVGDDAQTIYTFTGASASYLLDFPRHFPGTTEVTLVDNYRSTPQVLAVANRVLAAGGRATKQLRATAAGGPEPRIRELPLPDAEVAAVVAEVRRLLEAEGVAPGEIAICYRVNSQSEPYEQALARAGIPFVVRGAASFYDLEGVAEALRTLRNAAERPDGAVPAPGSATPAQPDAAREVERILRSKLSWREDREPAGEAARERWRNIGALVDIVRREVQADPDLSLPGVVTLLSGRAEAARADRGDASAVTLLSLHKAKGLEYDAVFIVGVEEGLLPITHAKTDAEVAEERRLLYVGMTRARRWLWVSWAAARERPGGRRSKRRPSRFLAPFLPAPAAQPKTKPVAGLQGAAAARAERLRAWRAERAKRDGKPAFVIFNDRTLAELANACPADRDELLAIHGFGPAKAERYGEDVLALLHRGRA